MSRYVSWELYRSFLAVARAGSLSGAARALQLAQPTLGRHVDELERVLGTPVFTRSPKGLLPTETGLALIPIAETMESASEAMLRAASGPAGAIAGVVRVTASEIVGAEILPPILAAFSADHPQIAFELHLSNQNADLLQRDADIAVRMARPTQTGLVARLLGRATVGLYAHRSYMAGKKVPARFSDLADFRLIGFDRESAFADAVGQAGLQVNREMFSLRTDNDLAQLAAIRSGYGIGGCQIGVACRDPDLVRLLPDFAVPMEVWLVMHEDMRQNPRLRAVFEHLARGMKAYLTPGIPNA